jgi:hypothetical protein
MTDHLPKILSELCAKHDSNDIAADMIGLFEDIRKFFSDNDKDCIDFESLSAQAQEALYEQITLLISLFKQMRCAADKTTVMETISKIIVSILSKHKERAVLLELDRQAQAIIKQRFSNIVFLDLYHKQRTANLTLHPKQIHKRHQASRTHKKQDIKNTGLAPMR